MPTWPRITVITPSFNQADYLEDAIASVLGQRYPNLEYMVLDGGSSDGSSEIIARYQDQLSFWRSEADTGQAAAINEGLTRSSGDILCWLNSDDMYLPRSLFAAAEALDTREADFIYGGCLCFYEGAANDGARNSWPRPFDARTLTYRNYIEQPSAFWTRALWEQVGPLNERYEYAFDWEWWIRASQCCRLRPYPKHLSLYRFHGDHKTSTGGISRLKEVAEIIDRFSPLAINEAYDTALNEGAQWAGLFHEMLAPRHAVRPLRNGEELRKIELMTRAMQALAEQGIRRVGIYGAGAHTRQVLPALVSAPMNVLAIIDDRAVGHVGRWEVMTPEASSGLDLQAVVLSSDAHEDKLWARRGLFESRGIQVVRLYGDKHHSAGRRRSCADAALFKTLGHYYSSPIPNVE